MLQVLLCLPRLQRASYEHLMSKPRFLVEQLLMNMKVRSRTSSFFDALGTDAAVVRIKVL